MAIFQTPRLPTAVEAIILIEPVHILPPIANNDERLTKGTKNSASAGQRKTKFESLEKARLFMKKHPPWRTWDERALDSYIVC